MLAYTMPFWVVLFAWILLGDRPTQRHLWAFGLAALGLVAIIAPWEGLGSMTGSLPALAGGACWGVGTVLAQKIGEASGRDRGCTDVSICVDDVSLKKKLK